MGGGQDRFVHLLQIQITEQANRLLTEEKIAATTPVLAAATPWIAWSIVTACGPADFSTRCRTGPLAGSGLPPHRR